MLNQILELTKLLVSHPSTNTNPKALKSVLEEAIKPLKENENLTIEHFEKNQKPSVLIYLGKTRPKKFKIILNAHLDVVGGKPEQFKPYEKGGRLYGRGVIDMKSAAAVEVLVFKELVEKVNYALALQLVTDEEVGGFDGTKHQIEKIPSAHEQGVRADFVIAGEPTNLGINNRAKGIIWLKIQVKGKSAHGAYPWEGENALIKAKKIVDKIYNVYPLPKSESWQTTFNLAKIETPNETFNRVPDKAVVYFDIRYIPEEIKSLPFEKGRKLLEKKIKKLVGSLGEVDILLFEPPQFTDQRNYFIVKLQEAVKQNIGKKADIIVKHGGSDIRHYNQVGCDGVTFGPIGGNLHGDEEWIEIKSLEKYYQILKDFLLKVN